MHVSKIGSLQHRNAIGLHRAIVLVGMGLLLWAADLQMVRSSLTSSTSFLEVTTTSGMVHSIWLKACRALENLPSVNSLYAFFRESLTPSRLYACKTIAVHVTGCHQQHVNLDLLQEIWQTLQLMKQGRIHATLDMAANILQA